MKQSFFQKAPQSVAVVPAHAGTQQNRKARKLCLRRLFKDWIPACAGMTVLMLSACASKQEEPVERSPEAIFSSAQKKFADRDFTAAAKEFEEVDRQHPYAAIATDASLNAAFSYYNALKYSDAIAALDNFIELHPNHPQIAYAFYLRALCYYEQIVDITRDQTATAAALDGLSDVVRRFPNTPYARDAQFKIDLTRDHLAGKEMMIGRYYLQRGLYQAAAQRFQNVVKDYQTTNQAPEALHRLVEVYVALGIREEAEKYAAVLGYNYPDSDWYKKSYTLLKKKS